MADGPIKITVTGLKELQAAIAKFPKQVEIYMVRAGQESARKVILTTRGMQKYPPAGEANAPRSYGSFYSIATRKVSNRWYQRGYGSKWALKGGGTGGSATSENLGKQWYVMHRSTFTTEIGNRASYAKYVHDDEQQARFMAPKGWRKLKEVATEKMPQLVKVYDAWIKKLLHDIKLT
jgi:hypothetical protein